MQTWETADDDVFTITFTTVNVSGTITIAGQTFDTTTTSTLEDIANYYYEENETIRSGFPTRSFGTDDSKWYLTLTSNGTLTMTLSISQGIDVSIHKFTPSVAPVAPVAPVSSASATGDPYITPIYGNLYKLPNRTTYYRLLKHNDTIINGSCPIR